MQRLIQAIDGWEDLTADAIRTALITSDPQRRPTDEARHTAASLAELFGGRAAESMVAALRAEDFPAMADSLVARGLDFGNPELQTTLDDLAASAPSAFGEGTVAALRSLGVDSRSPWQRANGDDPEPTVEDVQAGLDAIEAERAKDAIINRANAATSAASQALDNGLSAAEITQAAEAAWTGA